MGYLALNDISDVVKEEVFSPAADTTQEHPDRRLKQDKREEKSRVCQSNVEQSHVPSLGL